MPFAALSPGDFILLIKHSKKFSSTLQNMQATDFCINTTDYSRNIVDAFPGSKQYSKIFRASNTSSLGRAFLSTHLRGIITVEASIILPIYILIISSIIYLFNILYIQNTFQERMSEIAREISSNYYIACSISSLNNKETLDFYQYQTQNESSFSNTTYNITSSLITASYISKLFSSNDIQAVINSSNIVDKANGLSFNGTYLDTATNDLFIHLSYKIRLPFLPWHLSLPIKQFCKLHLFYGKNITPNKGDTTIYVYCNLSGNVYHTNKYCSYLTKYTSVVPVKDIPTLGMIACYRCNYPAYSTNAEYVYLTTEGDRYHYSLDCPTFTSHIYKIDYTQLASYFRLCTRCEELIN